MKYFRRVGQQIPAFRLIVVLVVILLSWFVLEQHQQYRLDQSKKTNSAAVAQKARLPVEALARTPVDCQKEACLALSFDDGPDPQTTPRLLAALEGERVRATFFVIGSRIAGREVLLRHLYNAGNEIGNHSWSHSDFTKLKPDQMTEQIERTQSAVVAAGLPAPRLFRAPYGTRNQTMRDTIKLPLIYWNIDPHDWHEPDPTKIADQIQRQAHAGGIMILHDNHLPTALAARQFIHVLKTRYRLVTISELLQLAPDALGEYFGYP